MKSAQWHHKHLADGDHALDMAGQILAAKYYSEDEITRANTLIALARAHYRACEVDARLREVR